MDSDRSDEATRLTAALGSRFTVERVIGEGGMATVHLATDHRHRRTVAIKILRPELTQAIGRQRFLREIETLGGLTHPHILPLYDSGVVKGLFYFIMPHVQGETLRKRLQREGQLPIDEAITIACEIADGLGYAHERGIIHRDIKPGNIMLESGHAVIADFGIALALSGDAGSTRLTSAQAAVGTPQYMSPEQAAGGDRLDGRCDIYSLGCVLYEMLAGHPPFTGGNPHAIMARHAVEPPPSLRVVRPTVPEGLEAIVFRALAKAPADRFRTAFELGEALEDVAHERVRTTGRMRAVGAAVGPGNVPNVSATPAPPPKYPRLVAAAAGVMAGITALGFLTVIVRDSQLQIADAYTPTESNFFVIGVRSLVGPVVLAFFALVGFLILDYAFRLLVQLMSRVPWLGRRISDMRTLAFEHRRRRFAAMRPRAAADGMLMTTIAVVILAVIFAAPSLAALFSSDEYALGCESRVFHRSYIAVLTIIAVVLATVGYRVFRWVEARENSARIRLAKWTSATAVFLLVVLVTFPWLLMWRIGSERVRIGDDRGYLIVETDTRLIVYNASRRTSAVYSQGSSELTRMGVNGHVFEEPYVFESGLPGCQAVTGPFPAGSRRGVN